MHSYTIYPGRFYGYGTNPALENNKDFPRQTSHDNEEAGMIQLYTFPEAFGLRNVSPFCLKIEMALTWLGELASEFSGLREYAERVQAEVGVHCRAL